MKGKNFMSNINLSEISSLIKKQIEAYKDDIKTETIGTVVEVGDGIAIVHGLDKAMQSELLIYLMMFMEWFKTLKQILLV